MYSRVVIAIDGSPFAEKGLGQGLDLAKSLGAAVTIVAVSEPFTPMWTESSGLALADYALAERSEKDAETSAAALLDAAKTRAGEIGIAAQTTHIKNAHPADGIIEAAEKTEADLIVVASHGRRGMERLLLGSQTHEVLTRSKISVLVVK